MNLKARFMYHGLTWFLVFSTTIWFCSKWHYKHAFYERFQWPPCLTNIVLQFAREWHEANMVFSTKPPRQDFMVAKLNIDGSCHAIDSHIVLEWRSFEKF